MIVTNFSAPGGLVKFESSPMELRILLVTFDGYPVTRQEIIVDRRGKSVLFCIP